uniref:Cytochrome c oxidase assembly factor 5 n=1 Tax=Scleropages formosus TaxID=113540 RepID=A0A8C9STA9_SCLFO
MPKYYEDKEEDNRACAGLREDFKACLLQHDCVLKEGKKPSECVKEGHCRALQVSFFECKRSMTRSDKIEGTILPVVLFLHPLIKSFKSEVLYSSVKKSVNVSNLQGVTSSSYSCCLWTQVLQ